MCGISGFNWKDESKVAKMVQALSHRGPDADGIFVDEGVSLGHNRLSIIDLSSNANQPMFDNEKELVIVFNGEIYNFEEIKRELEGEYKFKTKSDTEVILAGYRKWGRMWSISSMVYLLSLFGINARKNYFALETMRASNPSTTSGMESVLYLLQR